ncbi:MAG: fumarate hydratase [Planctomycetes bacterium GWA2_50_13]|nr:MAG: fumarate hydratase [Planctomycetes bacterium GWA2_50_13]OHB92115.1 MAG: fumarate hydratase [Planctomycetes bacterium RIFCSPHIGHO2_12_FULL_51_37]OHB95144.1 MAG: fumarate hydratase [Planctomycetes bacterium RIFCSPLOWO2_02_FULL_50_16]OHC03517.1 MAG: fumarate hydratase [Planctomycetes bacterium RIFCSPLOWO2_12_FULL_50_35]HCN19929.1 Fe-S-containing hydro-lyase [Planctomycetia bacterium]
MNDVVKIRPPLDEKTVRSLKAGQRVLITGTIYTARDAAHKRMMELIKKNEPLPFDLKGQIIYYVGPTPAKPGQVVGSAGPTTSSRMDSYMETLYKLGLKGTIGKGNRSQEVIDLVRKYKAVHFSNIGGAGALIAKTIRKCEMIAFEDLGTEAIHRMEVENFSAIVAYDSEGNDLYKEAIKQYGR